MTYTPQEEIHSLFENEKQFKPCPDYRLEVLLRENSNTSEAITDCFTTR